MYISSDIAMWHVRAPVSLALPEVTVTAQLAPSCFPALHQQTCGFFFICFLTPLISLYDLFSSRIMTDPGLCYQVIEVLSRTSLVIL